MITFIESGNRIATENFETGEIYAITYTNGNYRTMCCIGIGTDFVMFQGTSPNALFCLTLGTAETVSTIELGGGGSGTINYNELENKPQINGIVLTGNKTASDLNLVSQNDLDNYVTDTELSTELADYATNASVVAGLAIKQDALNSSQLQAVNSGITSTLVTQIGTNENNISLLTPTVKDSGNAFTVGTDYTLVDACTLTVPIPTSGVKCAHILAGLAFNSTAPRGIIISLSNDISDFNASSKLLAKVESSDFIRLTAECFYYNYGGSNVNIYVWAKSSSRGINRVVSSMQLMN